MKFTLEEYNQMLTRRAGWNKSGARSHNLPNANKGKAKAGARLGEPGYSSPHALALAALVKDPSLLERNHEHYAQVRVMDWAERYEPELYDHISAVPNGGQRHKKTAADLKAEGVKSGYPDLIIDYPAGDYHGARVEMKANGGKPSETQITMLRRLAARGYRCALCDGAEEAIAFLKDYIALQPGELLPYGERDRLWLPETGE